MEQGFLRAATESGAIVVLICFTFLREMAKVTAMEMRDVKLAIERQTVILERMYTMSLLSVRNNDILEKLEHGAEVAIQQTDERTGIAR